MEKKANDPVVERTNKRIEELDKRRKELRRDLSLVEGELRYLQTGLAFAYQNHLLREPEITNYAE